MKKTFIYLAMAALALAACQKEAPIGENASSQKQMRTFKCVIANEVPTDKVSISDEGKTAWEVGDEILVHTGHIRSGDYTTVTLAAENISEDGKTATFTIPELNVYDWIGNDWGEGYSDYYAAYPASAVDLGTSSCYCRSYFKETNTPLMAAYEDKGVFEFYNLCGLITFSVEGEFDGYVFSGNGDETVGYDIYAVELTGKGQNFLYKKTAGPKNSVAADLEADGKTVHYVCLPNGANFSNGFTFKFKDGTEPVQVAVNKAPVEVARGQILNLGDLTSHLKDYVEPSGSDHKSEIPTANAVDLSANGAANCYILTAPGTYKLPALKGASDIEAGNVYGVELLWETCNSSEAPAENSIIAALDFEDNWLYFQTPETLKYGNALLAAKNDEGAIIWSWHIWIPESAPSSISADEFYNKAVMDRNLGALRPAKTSDLASETYGLYYQWGRKDPLSASLKFTHSVTAVSAPQTTDYAIQHPNIYIKGSENTGQGNWNSDNITNLWKDGDEKTIYDPCPAGYRVPVRNSSYGMWYKDENTCKWTMGDGYFEYVTAATETSDSQSFVFPMCGYMEGGVSAYKLNQRCIIWGADVGSGDEAADKGRTVYLRYDKTPVYYTSSYFKYIGGTIRCVAE